MKEVASPLATDWAGQTDKVVAVLHPADIRKNRPGAGLAKRADAGTMRAMVERS
jgi:hypothetical protein